MFFSLRKQRLVISLFLLERVKNKHPKNPVNPVKKKLVNIGDVVD